MNRPVGLASFDQQSRLAHALVVVAAVGAFWLGYFGTAAAVFGDASVLVADDPWPGRAAAAVGAALSSATLGVAFVRGYGGPVLNVFLYPLIVFGTAPPVGRLFAFGPEALDPLEYFLSFGLEPLVTVLSMVVPAAVVFLVTLGIWSATLEESERRAWERRYLPDEFAERFAESADG